MTYNKNVRVNKNHSCVFFFFDKIREKEVQNGNSATNCKDDKEVKMKLKEIKEMIEHLKKILNTLDKIYHILNQDENKEENNATS
jgi:hypothetical protein